MPKVAARWGKESFIVMLFVNIRHSALTTRLFDDQGPLPLDVLGAKINAWIAAQK